MERPHLPTIRLRVPPPELLARLREVDPRAELIYMGAGKWKLGIVQPDREKERTATERIGKLLELRGRIALHEQQDRVADVREELHRRLVNWRLFRRGFRPIQTYEIQGEPDGRVVADLRARDWRWRHRFTEELKERSRESEGYYTEQAKRDAARDKAQADGPGIFRRIMRGARSFISPGIPG